MNGTQAYLSLHPNSSYNNARSSAADILAKPSVKAEIRRRIDEMSMSADEAMLVLTDHARGDVSKFMDLSSVGWNVSLIQTDEDGNPVLGTDGKVLPKPETRVIRKLKQRVTTVIGKGDSEDREIVETEIELYDAQAAARDILKLHGKFSDTSFNIDLSILSTEQLERIAKGENVLSVLANPSAS